MAKELKQALVSLDKGLRGCQARAAAHCAAGKLSRQWPAALWGPLKLEPVAAVPVSLPQDAPQPRNPVRLQTNDEALVDNKDVASLLNAKDMTPDLYASGPLCCFASVTDRQMCNSHDRMSDPICTTP